MMENNADIYKILLEMKEEQGKIHSKVDALNDKVTIQNGRVAFVEKKIQKFEISYGKVGVMLSAITFILVAVFNFGLEWIKRKIYGQ